MIDDPHHLDMDLCHAMESSLEPYHVKNRKIGILMEDDVDNIGSNMNDNDHVMHPPYPQWTPHTLRPGKNIFIVGKRGTGKTVLLNDLMFHLHRHYDMGLACSPTQDTIQLLERHMPRTCIHQDIGSLPIVLERLLHTLESLYRQGKRKNVYIILDDCLYDARFLRDRHFVNILGVTRSYGITIIVCMQYTANMPPHLRSRFDYVLAFRDSIASNREKIRQLYLDGMRDRAFQRAFDRLTRNYQCMVIDCCALCRCSSPHQGIYRYRAALQHHHLMGNRDAWKLHYLFLRRMPKVMPSIGEDNVKSDPMNHVMSTPTIVTGHEYRLIPLRSIDDASRADENDDTSC